MNPIDKKVKDLMGFTFPQEQQIPLAPQAEIPQMEGLVPQQSDIQIPMIADTQEVVPQVQQPTEDPRLAQYESMIKALSQRQQAPRVSAPSQPSNQSDFRDNMMEQLKQTREENKQELDSARQKDSKTQLANQLMKSFSQIGEGLANRAGTTNIKMPATQFASEQAQAIATDNKDKLAGLMEQYSLMSDKEKAKIDAETRKLNAEDKAFDRQYKQQLLQLEGAKLLNTNKEKAGEGQKTLDRQFAKEYNDWTSGGAKVAQSEIQKLKGVADKLRQGQLTTGALTGLFPDRMTSNQVLGARADVESTVMNSLRAILGAQFTENEGKRIIQNTWNEGDSTENNLGRLDRLVNDLSNKANDKNQKAQYFKQNKETLSGYEPSSSTPNTVANEVERKTKDGKTAIFDATTKQFLRYK